MRGKRTFRNFMYWEGWTQIIFLIVNGIIFIARFQFGLGTPIGVGEALYFTTTLILLVGGLLALVAEYDRYLAFEPAPKRGKREDDLFGVQAGGDEYEKGTMHSIAILALTVLNIFLFLTFPNGWQQPLG